MTQSPHRTSPPHGDVRSGASSGDAVESLPRQARNFQGRPAGLVSRLAAAAIDGVVVVLLLFGCYVAVAFVQFVVAPQRFTLPVPSGFLRTSSVGVVCLLYLAVSWTLTGSSCGARLLGLRLQGPDGLPPGPARAALRALFCMLLPITLFWCAFDHRSRAVHDLLFNTRVVYDWRPILAHR